MKIIVTADLHYDIERSIAPTRALAEDVCNQGGDALLIVGDTCGRDLTILSDCLQLFDNFPGTKMLTAGNHDLWVNGEDSYDKYQNRIQQACDQAGVIYLDNTPHVIDHVGFVGSVGWYDYTFRLAALAIPLRFYQAKVAPGAAARLEEHADLVRDANDLTPEMMDISTRWMDGVHVNLPMSDIQFTIELADKLRRHIDDVSPKCETVVAAVHHLPFDELVQRKGIPQWDFAGAFLGSEVFGDVLSEAAKVHFAFCGHSHQQTTYETPEITLKNIGSTYKHKRYETLNL